MTVDAELPKGLQRLGAVLRALGMIELALAVVAFASAVSITVVQIAMRYLWGTSLIWAQEVTLLLMLFTYFVGAAVVFRMRHYVVIAFLVDRVPPAFQYTIYLLVQAVIFVFWAIVVYEVALMIPDGLRTRSPMIQLPRIYFNLPLLVAGVSIMLTTLYCTAAAIAIRRRGSFAGIEPLERRVAVL